MRKRELWLALAVHCAKPETLMSLLLLQIELLE